VNDKEVAAWSLLGSTAIYLIVHGSYRLAIVPLNVNSTMQVRIRFQKAKVIEVLKHVRDWRLYPQWNHLRPCLDKMTITHAAQEIWGYMGLLDSYILIGFGV